MQFGSSFPFIFLLLCLVCAAIAGQSARPKFEALSGVIDDCCCNVQTVDDSLYNEHMHSMLSQLVGTTFFRYFKVNYLKECPFWEDERTQCSIDGPGECGICECDENEIPQAWNVNPTNKDTIVSWKEKDEDVWIFQDDTDETLYVNLQTNPERYTGYGGGTSVNIWQMIYKENCFPDPYECTEERVFYRLISGLHASTTAHICENYHQPDNSWAPNLDMFIYRLGAFPDRLKNIYFTFVYLLRAAKKASDFLNTYDYYTAHPEEDKRVQSLVRSLLSSSLVCSDTFDETNLFQGERAALKREFMTKFRNISQIMDCVSCQTCKVHAKLQILGIATATKILLSSDPNIIKGLQHNEISSLINTLFKFSESIQIIHNMKAREDEHLKKLAETPANDQPTNSQTTTPQDSNTKDQTTNDQSTKGQPTKDQPIHHKHSSMYALILGVLLVTVAILYSSRNTFSSKNNNLKDTKTTETKTNALRRSSEQLKSKQGTNNKNQNQS